MFKTVILIPARMASTRFPNKPLADIHGIPMITHVMNRSAEAGVGDVIVACAEQEIADAIHAAGGKAILTDPDHPSGTDRIYEALQKVEEEQNIRYECVVNVQGDLPNLDPSLISTAVSILETNPASDIGTLVALINNEEELNNPNVTKAAVEFTDNAPHARALYFSRNPIPSGAGQHYHHIGLYTFKRQALERFVSLQPSALEQREKLEQLRALEHDLRIDAALVSAMPLGVDTPEDLEVVKAQMQG